MSAADLLTVMGPAITLIETFPVWGPFVALVGAVLICQAVRMTWGTGAEDTVPDVPPVVPGDRDRSGDSVRPGRVTCGDTDPRVSHWPGRGGP
jgi:hypothetical protein